MMRNRVRIQKLKKKAMRRICRKFNKKLAINRNKLCRKKKKKHPNQYKME